MRKVCCYTSLTYSYLDRARVLAETVRRYHPDWSICALLSDELPDSVDPGVVGLGFDRIVNIQELGIPDLEKWMFGHDIVELCTAVKGPMMDKLLAEGYDAVVYLDPDTALFSPLDDVLTMLERHSIVLTPHVVQAEETLTGVIDNEIGSLKHGVYNLGFVAVRNDVSGRAFARWWRDRLLHFCHDDVPNGLFTDQRWCDLVPALFDGVGVLRNPGYNVASWNLATRPIRFDTAGNIYSGGAPLRFFHFTKVNSVGEAMLERYSYGASEVFELLRWYRERLAAHKLRGLPSGWWAYGVYTDGKAIKKAERLIWRHRGDVREHFTSPYTGGPHGFHAWCAAHGVG
ncbi:hypothetical protein CAL14_19670 [Bordetella genomosp. 9]|uniref:hypothetical protein n=1 Tax=Bordetella genomosp. 9 TaxID=1416803 RepID=UPI000A28D556|nr:hypothetical protein [Bordetella genomosp. 9]ARP92227.1 hypothetical protein CAL14_19670 [Bordetella genomosp. 9]